MAKPTLAKVKVLVVCKDFGFGELIVWVFGNCLGFFFCVELSWVVRWRWGCVKGSGSSNGVGRKGGEVAPQGGPKPRKGGAPKGGGAQNFAFFFPLLSQNAFSLWGSSRGILVVFEAPAAPKPESGPGKGGEGRSGGRAGPDKGPRGTEHDQTKTLKPTPTRETPRETSTHATQHTHTHTHTTQHNNTTTQQYNNTTTQ